MLSTDCDRWTTCMFHDRLDFMKLLDMHACEAWIIFMMLNYKNGPPKYQFLHFYTMNIAHTVEYHPYRPHMRLSWWKNCSKCMLWSAISELPRQQAFDWCDHFHLVQWRAVRLATIVGPWWTVSDYCIPQHKVDVPIMSQPVLWVIKTN